MDQALSNGSNDSELRGVFSDLHTAVPRFTLTISLRCFVRMSLSEAGP